MTHSLFDLNENVAIVVGGTGVLGGGMAEALATAGAKVAVLGRNEERGQKRVASIQSQGGQACFVTADVSNISSLQAARDSLVSQWGPANILVNAAGGNRPDATLPPGSNFCELPVEA
ncbi:MAG: SDR family NAD(P)-dependent oxidoreductase, partial [Planctomycetota bacterium]|nr:SDR family NAD(P)-dependent oxidoreductase [Planctomycetota bacterium]